MDSKLVVIFGGSGFLGRQTVRALARAGWRIRVAVRYPHKTFFLKPAGTVGQIAAVKCDITDPDQVAAALHGADAAVNLAGMLYPAGQSFDDVHVDGAAVRSCVLRVGSIGERPITTIEGGGATAAGAAGRSSAETAAERSSTGAELAAVGTDARRPGVAGVGVTLLTGGAAEVSPDITRPSSASYSLAKSRAKRSRRSRKRRSSARLASCASLGRRRCGSLSSRDSSRSAGSRAVRARTGSGGRLWTPA